MARIVKAFFRSTARSRSIPTPERSCGKLGILWEVDRVSGKFIAAHDLGYQTLVDVDTTTGAVTYRPGMLPKAGDELEFCPDIQGVRNWRATAYDPGTRALYIPIHPGASTAEPVIPVTVR